MYLVNCKIVETYFQENKKIYNYFSDGFDERVVSLVEGQGPGAVDDSAVDVSSEIDLKKIEAKFLICTQ
jgi:hypothetical protein